MTQNPSSIRIRTLLFLTIVVWPVATTAKADEDLGKQIYVRQCASCHGDAGEGVEGKYSEPLFGDLSLQSLTDLISDTMPEEDPDLCVADDAQAVAQFVFDAFYSAKAQTRFQPKIELAHRTNIQHRNSIADLLSRFSGKIWLGDKKPAPGLKGNYFASRGFDSTKKLTERVDPSIDFDFGSGSPLDATQSMEEFGIQWFGAVVIEETGQYDFFVESPNGFRLFVNDDRKPLIDAWVTSGNTSHQASAFLLAGQSYLIKLEMFKFKDESASISLKWKPPLGNKEGIPADQLIPIWAPLVLVSQTALPPDDSSVGYGRGTSISKAWLEATSNSAVEIANKILARKSRFAGIKRNDNPSEKLKTFCSRFAMFAFGRPLTDEQQTLYVDSQFEKAETAELAAKQSIVLILQSPRFLYPELGVEKPDNYSVASRLALTLWDSIPDQELWSAAKGNNLTQRWGIDYQANRMLKDVRTRAKIREFFHHWLQMDQEDLSKDSELYPGFTDEIKADLRTSLDLFLEDVVWSESSDFRRFYQSNEFFVNQRLAKYYDVPLDPSITGFQKVSLAEGERAGVLTHPYIMTHLAHHRTTSPIHRGVFVARRLIGRSLKQPPENFEPLKEDFDPKMTTRERVAYQTKDNSCQACHSFINPLGFSLEIYDAVGRIQKEEKSRPIDAKGTYVTENGIPIELDGPSNLSQYLSQSEKTQLSFVQNLFEYLTKNPPQAYGPETVSVLHKSFAESEFNVQKLIVDIAKTAALHGTGVSIQPNKSNPSKPTSSNSSQPPSREPQTVQPKVIGIRNQE